LFGLQEIDGKAMLLLNSDVMMKYMGLKLGPALKICNIIGKFQNNSNHHHGNKKKFSSNNNLNGTAAT
jgi:hypothetical protein